MEDQIIDALWPKPPEDLLDKEVRLPSEFRGVVANRKYTNEEIGKIVRCLLLKSDLFNSPGIGGVVYYFRQLEARKAYFRDAVKKHRAKKKGVPEPSQTRPEDDFTVKQNDFTVKSPPQDEVLVVEPLSSDEKTPTHPKEKTPPIVPLKKKVPSFLEKARLEIQGDLFDDLKGTTELADTRIVGPVARPGILDEKTIVQDIERAPRPVEDASGPMRASPTASDSRSDAAWIPQKFEMFWAKYPRKVAKKDAIKAFTKIVKGQKDVGKFMDTLLASIEWWKAQPGWKKDGGKYIPYPGTWLNRGNWEDSVDNGAPQGSAEFMTRNQESDDELIRRMTGGSNG